MSAEKMSVLQKDMRALRKQLESELAKSLTNDFNNGFILNQLKGIIDDIFGDMQEKIKLGIKLDMRPYPEYMEYFKVIKHAFEILQQLNFVFDNKFAFNSADFAEFNFSKLTKSNSSKLDEVREKLSKLCIEASATIEASAPVERIDSLKLQMDQLQAKVTQEQQKLSDQVEFLILEDLSGMIKGIIKDMNTNLSANKSINSDPNACLEYAQYCNVVKRAFEILEGHKFMVGEKFQFNSSDFVEFTFNPSKFTSRGLDYARNKSFKIFGVKCIQGDQEVSGSGHSDISEIAASSGPSIAEEYSVQESTASVLGHCDNHQ